MATTNDLTIRWERDRLQAIACRVLEQHYSGCLQDVLQLLTCSPDSGAIVSGLLDGSVYEFERVAHALIIARTAMGLQGEGHA
jgi:hypothetical protein